MSAASLIRSMLEAEEITGSLNLWFLGQSGVAVQGGGMTIYIDPYLTDAVDRGPKGLQLGLCRSFPPPIHPLDVTNADLILITHEHLDHFDPESLGPMLTASPQAMVVAPPVLRSRLEQMGVGGGRYLPAVTDRLLQVGAASVMPVPAAHEEFDESAELGHRYVGYVVRLNGVTFYHAGDTVVYEGLPERIRGAGARLLFLPINGRDWGRHQAGILRGNMTAREAADLAAAVGADLTVPLHWDLYPWNGEQPGRFSDYVAQYHPSLPYMFLPRARRFRYCMR